MGFGKTFFPLFKLYFVLWILINDYTLIMLINRLPPLSNLTF